MKQSTIKLESIISELAPTRFEKYSSSKFIIKGLKKLIKINEINKILENYEGFDAFEFIEYVFNHLDFSYTVSRKYLKNIPSEGRLIVVANHPLGGLDALSLILLISEVRKDLNIIANDVLTLLPPIEDILIPVDVFSNKFNRNTFIRIEKAMEKEEVVILFPAGEVSRMSTKGIKDGKWSNSAVKLSRKYQAPILPSFINAKNSNTFYFTSGINKVVSTTLLPSEIFKKESKTISIKIGEPISPSAFNKYMSTKVLTKLLKKHTYKIGNGGKNIFYTEKNVSHPVDRKQIQKEINNSIELISIDTNSSLRKVNLENGKNIIKEISRLREITYRKVGEGTGKSDDKDSYDRICDHLVLWNQKNLDIVGSYRLGDVRKIIEYHGLNSIYNSSLFEFSEGIFETLNQTLELGRSFIQEKYWRSNSLDHLWKGIGAYLLNNSHIRYLFGAVSISNSFDEESKALIVSYYKKWFSHSPEIQNEIKPKCPYCIDEQLTNHANETFIGNNYKEDFKILKDSLRKKGKSIPVLLRKYTELCVYGGASFLAFGIDKDFSNSIDCIILVDLNYVKDDFRNRYLRNEYKDEKIFQ